MRHSSEPVWWRKPSGFGHFLGKRQMMNAINNPIASYGVFE